MRSRASPWCSHFLVGHIGKFYVNIKAHFNTVIRCYSAFINLCESYRMLTLILCFLILVEHKSYFVTWHCQYLIRTYPGNIHNSNQVDFIERPACSQIIPAQLLTLEATSPFSLNISSVRSPSDRFLRLRLNLNLDLSCVESDLLRSLIFTCLAKLDKVRGCMYKQCFSSAWPHLSHILCYIQGFSYNLPRACRCLI